MSVNLLKWFRRNNKKVMAVVVVVIMLGFIGGSYMQYLSRQASGMHSTVAYFGENEKITQNELSAAAGEIENILRPLSADELLRSQGLGGILLAELLFNDQQASPDLVNRMKQMIRANEYRVSDRQISDIYKRSAPRSIYWLMLSKEAESAGVRIPDSDCGTLLGRLIPQLFQGQSYTQRIRMMMNRGRMPEKQILAVFGRLLAVLQYAQIICSTENVTDSQMKHLSSRQAETIDAELVRISADAFVGDVNEPQEQAVVEHFNKYKALFAGDISEENPYGFGYKSADRVRLEYIAVRLDDVSATIKEPADQEMEEYYQRHIDQFIESIPTDPNDPNSPLEDRTKSYAEVVGDISERLKQEKINSKAEAIIHESRNILERDLQDVEPEKLTVEQLRQKAGDYETVAVQLATKYNVEIYAGRTGLVNPLDMQADEYLGRLFVRSYGAAPVALGEMVFSIEQLRPDAPELLRSVRPKLYENIGPVRDILGEMMLMVRIIEAKKAAEPQSVNETFSIAALNIGPEKKDDSNDVYSVREKLVEDIKRLSAMDTAREKAEQFSQLVAKDGWDGAINKFNKLYAGRDPNAPNIFKLDQINDLRRASSGTLEIVAAQNQGSPTAQFLLNVHRIQMELANKLYSLVPADSNSIDAAPLVTEFRPDMSCYVIKSLSVKRLWRQDYEQMKTKQFYGEDLAQAESLAAIHFNPENILKRMNFRSAEAKQAKDANTPAESEGAS